MKTENDCRCDKRINQLSEIVAPITGESWKLIHASAMSRAKAFLIVFDKWEEAQ